MIAYHIGVDYILLPSSPRSLFHFVPPHVSMFSMVDINPCLALGYYLSFCKLESRNQITQLVPVPTFLLLDVLARMWVYNRINIFIYCLFLYLFVLVVGPAIL